jgi:hypothetical protein
MRLAATLGGIVFLVTACGATKHAAPPPPPPVPLTSHYLCSRLQLAELRTLTGDRWHTTVAAKRPDIACDVRISETQPGEVHVMVSDGRRPGADPLAAKFLATTWFDHETGFNGFRQLPDGSAFNASDGVLVVQDGLVVYSVQVLSPRHPGRAALPIARKILALVHA